MLERLERWGAERAWTGPDPYEALNSPLGRRTPTRRARQALTQLYKRLPFPPPWPLRPSPTPNAKALALALSAYATPAGRRLPGAAEHLDALPDRLAAMALPTGGSGDVAWGYPFPVQTRNIGYGPESPNAIATCFVVDALLDAHEAGGDPGHLALALSARPFLVSLRRDSEHGPFFGYVRAGSDLIHNANLMVGGTLARLHGHDPDRSVAELVRETAATSVRLQRADGLWPYGEARNFGWIDNFHTAYALEGLTRIALAHGIGGAALAGGYRAWRDAFLEPDGWARPRPDRRLPLEAHACASAVDLLSQASTGRWIAERLQLARRIAARAVAELWLPREGRFAFERGRRRLNRRPYVRWTNAPMFRALARLESAESEAS